MFTPKLWKKRGETWNSKKTPFRASFTVGFLGGLGFPVWKNAFQLGLVSPKDVGCIQKPSRPFPSRHFWVDDFPNFAFGGIWIRSLEGIILAVFWLFHLYLITDDSLGGYMNCIMHNISILSVNAYCVHSDTWRKLADIFFVKLWSVHTK